MLLWASFEEGVLVTLGAFASCMTRVHDLDAFLCRGTASNPQEVTRGIGSLFDARERVLLVYEKNKGQEIEDQLAHPEVLLKFNLLKYICCIHSVVPPDVFSPIVDCHQ